MPNTDSVHLTGHERTFDPDEIIVSKTDLDGKITYGNRVFYRLAGLEEKDCLNVQHNLIRHPEMPRAVFDLLWSTIKGGDEIFAYVVNRSSNGDHYWVFAHVTPSRDSTGSIIGYHSNRRVPNRKTLETHIIPLYKQLLTIEKQHASPKEGMAAAVKVVTDLLAEKKMSFNELMFSLGV
ncbi:MAG: PAS domain-containing protein [Rhodospirillales bacterium]|nr:PAS domain-containing protein [Rhodospirillales bacterium]